MRRGLLLSLALALGPTGCTDLLTDAPATPIRMSLALAPAGQSQGGLAEAFAMVDRIRVVVEAPDAGGTVVDRTVDFTFVDGEAVLDPVEVLATGAGPARLEVVLSWQSSTLFVGGTALQIGSGFVDVELEVQPVASELEIQPLPVFEALGESRTSSVRALLATGAQIPGVDVTWSVDDPEVATVTQIGVVTARAEGTTTLRARAELGGESVSGATEVRVEAVVDRVDVSPDPAEVLLGGSRLLTAVAVDRNGNPLDRSFSWTSDDTRLATVTGQAPGTGRVEGEAVGSTRIRASTGGRTGGATVRVVRPLVILTSDLPDAVQDAPYGVGLAADGGTGTFLWRIAGGALPTGMALSGDGELTGVPSAAGSYGFTVAVESGEQEVFRMLTLVVGVDRTSSIRVTVTLFMEPAAGVTVNLSGPDAASTVTDASGTALIGGLRQGTYVVSIDAGSDQVYFDTTSQELVISEPGTEAVVVFEGDSGSED